MAQFGHPPVSAFAAPQGGHPPEEAFGPGGEESDSPLFHSDDFRIWCMKVIPCTKRFVHDWTVCPFAHAGEKAVRRDPRTHNYTGIACPDMKKQSSCIRGDKCPYAHNVFEYWLHPTRYRTQLCNDGPTCKRSICFFAHSLEELRVPAVKPYVSPEALARASLEAIQKNPHPLGQQLANPASAMRSGAQLAAGMPPAATAAAQSGGAGTPRAAGARGGPAAAFASRQHSAPPTATVLAAHQQFGGFGVPGAAAMLPPGMLPQAPRMSAPARAPADFSRRMSLEGLKLSLTPSTPQWGADAMAGFPASPPAPAPGWAPEFGAGAASLPTSLGAPAYSAPSSCRPSFDTAAVCRASFDASAAAAAVAGYTAAASAGRLSANSMMGGGACRASSHDSLSGLEQGPVRASRDSDGAASDHAVSPTCGAGAADAVPAATTDQDLAQSLATLKIALTQQHVAAAAGSNHEIVISTLHQILKDAIAQHGGKMPNLDQILPGGDAGKDASQHAAAGSPALAASSSFFASAAEDPAAERLPHSGSSSGSSSRASHHHHHAAASAQQAQQQQQPWISTMGSIQWDAPPAGTMPRGERRLSGDSAGGHE